MKCSLSITIFICIIVIFVTSCSGTAGSKGIIAYDNTRIHSLDVEAKKYFEEANRYAKENKPKEAIEAYSRSIQADPSAAAYNGRCLEYYRTGQYDRAVTDANRAIMMSPKYPLPYLNRGNAHYRLKEYDAALKSYKRSIQLDPSNPESYYNLGQAYYRKGLLDEAMASYSKAVELDAGHYAAWYNKACILSQKKDPVGAMASLEKAVAAGYRDAERMQGDPSFESIRKLPKFRALLNRIVRGKKDSQ